jgi:3-methyladenine DNA glycosylase AlkD
MLNKLKKELDSLADKKKAVILQGFFKTGKGQYGEGDIFLGIKVPVQRGVAKKYLDLLLSDIQKLLNTKIHEYRLVALFILIDKYQKGSDNEKKKIYNLYLKNYNNINNWDLVDLSAPKIVGDYLLNKDRDTLYKLARSNHLWKKRIAILSTFSFIRNNDFKDSLSISEILLHDDHDLIHKAVGWMLREVGKRDQKVLEKFLDKHIGQMPRTMLRYAIERFEETLRKSYLKKK